MTDKLTMRAILPADPRSNAITFGDKKELIEAIKVVGRLNGKLACVAEARFYMARRSDGASPVYCALWVHGDKYTSGRGVASGYGYHKSSAALQNAIGSAGIELMGSNYARWGDQKPNFKLHASISGCGDGSMQMAMKAIARAAGARGELLIV